MKKVKKPLVRLFVFVFLIALIFSNILMNGTIAVSAAELPVDVAEGKEARTPFKTSDPPGNILNNDYAAEETWWYVGWDTYGLHDTPMWCMIKLDDTGVSIDGFKLYNGGNWGEWSWYYPINHNIWGWQIYSAGTEGDELWNKIENGYDDVNAQWGEDWGYIEANFNLLYDTATDADIPDGYNNEIYWFPSWPIPEGCDPPAYWDADAYNDAAIKSLNSGTYPNYEYFPNGPAKAKYIILAVTDPAMEGAVNVFEVFQGPDLDDNLPPNLTVNKEARTPFPPNPGEDISKILLPDNYDASQGWWIVQGDECNYGNEKPIWCMIKLGDIEITADGFKFYNGGNWGWGSREWDAPWFNIYGFQIYSAGDEGDDLWSKIENYYGDVHAQRDEDWAYITSNFDLLYDTWANADLPEGYSLWSYPVYPPPIETDPDDYDKMSAMSFSNDTYPNYERFPNGPAEAKYIILAATSFGYNTAIANFEVFGVPANKISVKGVTLPDEVFIAIGETKRIAAAIIPENATVKSLKWNSSNPSVAAVSNFGDVKGFSAGTTTVTVTTIDGNFTAECEVTVANVSPSGVDIADESCKIAVGQTKLLTAAVSPANATNKSVTWSSSNNNVATVDNNGSITGISEGTVIITVTTVDGGLTDICEIAVEFFPPTEINIIQKEYTVILGSKLSVWTEIEPDYAGDKRLSWSSADKSVVTVDVNTGRLHAVGIGSAIITATSVYNKDLTSQCVVTVVKNTIDKSKFFGITPTDSFEIGSDEWDYYADMGMQSLRIHLQNGQRWEDIAEVIKKANSLDIEVMMLVSYESYASNAEWVDVGWGTILRYDYNDAKKLIDVMETAVPYFSALGVKSWEIWNEQNGMWNIPVNDYARLLCEIYEKFKYGDNPWDPEATVVFGGLDAVNGPWGVNGVNTGSRDYVRDFYKTAAYKEFKDTYSRSPFDAFGIHPYNTVTADENGVMNYNELESAIRGVALDVLKDNGDGHIPVWITELGSQEPNNIKQAAELRAYIETAYAMPEVGRFHYFKYVYYGQNWGIVDGNRNPKLSLYEYTDVIKQYNFDNSSNTIFVNNVEILFEIIGDSVVLKPTQEQIMLILNTAENEIIFDLSGNASVDLYINPGCFKNVDKTIIIITDNGSGSVKTKSLYNNSGKNMLITVRKGKINFKNI